MVQLDKVVKKFDDQTVVENVSIDIRRGEFLTLLGPSGCGKTTTLRMIAGFEKPTHGVILLDGQHVESKQPYERDVNTVFQSYALFPHMNVIENVSFGLKMKKVAKSAIKERAMDALRLVQLENLANRNPDQLSGGQKQRIAIARALVNNPKVLLLDEPLGALDLKLRKQMQLELKHLQQKLGITFIYVTHDQEEALTMSDRIAVMNKGKLEQIGSPHEIYETPQTKFVADFVGETNLFEGKVKKVLGDNVLLDFDGAEMLTKNQQFQVLDTVYVAIRPERIKLKLWDEESKTALKGRIAERIYAGSLVKTIFVLTTGKKIIINEPAGDVFVAQNMEEVWMTWTPEHAVVMRR
ncbi:MAG: polyamine ABC transporter ATP-binding protein [Paenibacillaceae bacterium]